MTETPSRDALLAALGLTPGARPSAALFESPQAMYDNARETDPLAAARLAEVEAMHARAEAQVAVADRRLAEANRKKAEAETLLQLIGAAGLAAVLFAAFILLGLAR